MRFLFAKIDVDECYRDVTPTTVRAEGRGKLNSMSFLRRISPVTNRPIGRLSFGLIALGTAGLLQSLWQINDASRSGLIHAMSWTLALLLLWFWTRGATARLLDMGIRRWWVVPYLFAIIFVGYIAYSHAKYPTPVVSSTSAAVILQIPLLIVGPATRDDPSLGR